MQSSTHTLYLERLYHRTALPSRHASRPLRPVSSTATATRPHSDAPRSDPVSSHDSSHVTLLDHRPRPRPRAPLSTTVIRPPSSPSPATRPHDRAATLLFSATTVLALRTTAPLLRARSSTTRRHHGPTPRHEHPSRHEHSSDTRRPTIALLEPHDHDAQAARPRPAAAAAFAAARSTPGCAHDHRPRSRSRLGPHTSLHSLAHSLATLPA